MLLKILNVAYDLDLHNVNYEEGKSFPAIDLMDQGKRTVVQITSTGSVNKVIHTLQECTKNGIDKQFDHLYFYFLKGVEKNVRSDNTRIIQEKGRFDIENIHFLDHAAFYQQLNQMNDIGKIAQIKDLLEEQFADSSVNLNVYSNRKKFKKISYYNTVPEQKGIKIIKANEPKPTVRETLVINYGNANAVSLLRRAFLYLEDGEWTKADYFCEEVLNLEPENAQAYLGKLMVELHVHRQEDLPNCKKPFDKSNNFQKSVRFGDEKLSSTLKGYISHINERNENMRLTDIYNKAVRAMDYAGTEAAYKEASATFKRLSGFKDADSLSKQCLERAEICRKDAIYTNARSQMTGEAVHGYEAALRAFKTISGWKDTEEQIFACQRKIEEIKARKETERLEQERKAEQARIEAEKAAKKLKKMIAIVTSSIVVGISFVIIFKTAIIPMQKTNKAMELLATDNYDTAYDILEEVGKHDAVVESKHERAMELLKARNYVQCR